MLQRLRAVVLHSIKYGESGMITQTYTNLYGRQSFLVHGVRKKKSKISAYMFQPLNILDIVAYFNTSSDLHKVKEVQSAVHLNNLHFEVMRGTMAMFIGEILYRTLRETETNPKLFDYLEKSVQVLDMGERGIQNFHLIFLLQLTKFIGIFPGNHTEFDQYRTDTGMALSDLLDYSLGDIPELTIDGRTRKELLDQLILFFRHHIEGLGTIKSLEILHEVFH